MRRDEQRGRVGRWLRARRLERGYLTQESARSALSSWGWPVSASVFAEWESGSRVPSDENLARLEEFFGSRVLEVAQAPDQSVVAAAIDRQTAMFERMLRELTAAITLLDAKGHVRTGEVLEAVADVRADIAGIAHEGSPARSTAPTRHRTRTSRQPKPGQARPGWDEVVPELEESRGK